MARYSEFLRYQRLSLRALFGENPKDGPGETLATPPCVVEPPPRQPLVFLHETPLTRLSFLGGAGDTLFITFSPLRERLEADAIWAEAPLRKLNLPALGFVAKRDHWYPVEDTTELIKCCSEVLKSYKTIIIYGYSMGAYATLKFSAALRASKAVALSPQFSIDPQDVGTQDTRYRKYFMPDIHQRMALATRDIGGEPFILYDPQMREDVAHAGYIAGLAPCSPVVVPFAGHGTIKVISKSGVSAAFFSMLAKPETNPRDMRRFIRAARTNSPDYMCKMSDRLAARGRVNDAQRAVAQALTRDGGNIHTLFRQINLFMKSGQRDEALHAFEHLSTLKTEEAGHAVKMCHAYGTFAERHRTVARLREEAAKWPREPSLRLQLAHLLCDQGENEEARDIASKIPTRDLKSWQACKSLALLLYKLEEKGLAKEATRAAISRSPDDIEVRLFAADMFLTLRDTANARESIQIIERRHPLSEPITRKLQALTKKIRTLDERLVH